MPENFVQALANFIAFALKLPYLTAQLMPFGLTLLQLLFRLFLFSFDFLVLFQQAGYFRLQFF